MLQVFFDHTSNCNTILPESFCKHFSRFASLQFPVAFCLKRTLLESSFIHSAMNVDIIASSCDCPLTSAATSAQPSIVILSILSSQLSWRSDAQLMSHYLVLVSVQWAMPSNNHVNSEKSVFQKTLLSSCGNMERGINEEQLSSCKLTCPSPARIDSLARWMCASHAQDLSCKGSDNQVVSTLCWPSVRHKEVEVQIVLSHLNINPHFLL